MGHGAPGSVRLKLLWNPNLACERLGYWAHQRRRLKRLRGTVAHSLTLGHIESLELVESVSHLGIGTVYDIGANAGTWVLLAKAVLPTARVEAFEPLASHFPAFLKNVGNDSTVSLHKLALGSQNTTAVLHVTSFSDASSLLALEQRGVAEFGVTETGQVPVEVRRLDDYRAEHRLPFPDLIKLDVQGYEVDVLMGASECLEHARAIVAEVSFEQYYTNQCLLHDIVGCLAKHQFYVAAVGDRTQTGTLLTQTDVLFLRRS